MAAHVATCTSGMSRAMAATCGTTEAYALMLVSSALAQASSTATTAVTTAIARVTAHVSVTHTGGELTASNTADHAIFAALRVILHSSVPPVPKVRLLTVTAANVTTPIVMVPTARITMDHAMIQTASRARDLAILVLSANRHTSHLLAEAAPTKPITLMMETLTMAIVALYATPQSLKSAPVRVQPIVRRASTTPLKKMEYACVMKAG